MTACRLLRMCSLLMLGLLASCASTSSRMAVPYEIVLTADEQLNPDATGRPSPVQVFVFELRSGSTVLAVNSEGRTRKLTVGRAKLESRPILTITAHSPEGVEVCLTVQDDWHVRVLGPGGKVRNVTELQRGDELLGYIATEHLIRSGRIEFVEGAVTGGGLRESHPHNVVITREAPNYQRS